jgi:L-histidine N-alpha-methyltransferase
MTSIAASTLREEDFALAEAVRSCLELSPRQLPSRFLYDVLGSSLFDSICNLPWYRVTRAELNLLRRHALTIGCLFRAGGRIVELGCGNGEKLAALLTHAKANGVHAHLIDLSESALAHSVQTLATVGGSDIRVTTYHTTYEEGLTRVPAESAIPTLVALLGSNIGNFDAPEAAAFLGLIRAPLRPGDYLLLGADLIKPERELILAYDDPLGVTAAFNKNLLLRMNRELNADFVIDRFAHRAVWNRAALRVEMHLVSLQAQEVDVVGAGLRFRLEEGESIWTESSYKFTPEGICRLVESAGFIRRNQWIEEPARFALTLFQAV